MIEISFIVLSLIIEAYVVLLIGVITWFYLASKQKKKDRNAALKLVEQIKQQSEARQNLTSSHLKEKYNLEGARLKKAITLIDKSEKRFFQKVINLYLKRDSEALGSLDADVAELIDTFRSLTPLPAAENKSEKDEKIELLQEANTQLSEELAITNKTMSDMIAEFSNMFGGGSSNEQEQGEVVDKMIAQYDDEVQNDEIDDIFSDEKEVQNDEIDDILSAEKEVQNDEIDDILSAEKDAAGEGDVALEEEIDDLLDGIISSDK
jgi:hypothetical protein